MFTMMVLLRDREQAVMLWFKDRDRAFAARDRLAKTLETSDDFGHHFKAVEHEGQHPVMGMMVSEAARDYEVQGELALMQVRAQATAQTRANADPALRFMGASRPGLVG